VNPPKPTALKVLQGTTRADRANPAEPKPAVGAAPPPWLPRYGPARAAWRRLAPILTQMRVLTTADAEALGLACMALAEFLEAQSDASSWRRGDAAWKRYLAVLRDFGMTPSARTRVTAAPEEEADPLEAWAAR
jgi:phage terminase small subunit